MPGASVAVGAPTGRRERRVRETRRRILTAALELFGERGIDAVTVEEIADRADVARGTVFNHFPCKESLCQEMGSIQVELLQDALDRGQITGRTAGERLGQAMRLMAALPQADPANCRSILVRILAAMRPGELPEHRKQVYALYERWVTEGQRTGELRADVPAGELAAFVMGLQFQATLVWAFGFAPGSLEEHVTGVLQLALEGLRARPDPEPAAADGAARWGERRC